MTSLEQKMRISDMIMEPLGRASRDYPTVSSPYGWPAWWKTGRRGGMCNDRPIWSPPGQPSLGRKRSSLLESHPTLCRSLLCSSRACLFYRRKKKKKRRNPMLCFPVSLCLSVSVCLSVSLCFFLLAFVSLF